MSNPNAACSSSGCQVERGARSESGERTSSIAAAIVRSVADIVLEWRDWEPTYALSNSFAFGGHNGSLVFGPA